MVVALLASMLLTSAYVQEGSPPEGWPSDPIQAFQGPWASHRSKDNVTFEMRGSRIYLTSDAPAGEARYRKLNKGDLFFVVESFGNECTGPASNRTCSWRMYGYENSRLGNGSEYLSRYKSSIGAYSREAAGKTHWLLGDLRRPETKAAGIGIVDY